MTALQQDEFWQQFISEVSVYSPEILVFIDEMGTDRRSLVYKIQHAGKAIEKSHQMRPSVHNSVHIYGWIAGCEPVMVMHFTALYTQIYYNISCLTMA